MNEYYTRYRSASSTGKNIFRARHIQGLYKQFALNFGRLLPSDKSTKIVDIGCGAGELIGWLQSRGFSNVVGYDLSEEQIKEAQESFHGDFFCADVLSSDFDFPRADVFFLRDVLEHFDNLQIDEILSRLQTHLNPGGCIIIQTVNGSTHSGLVSFYSDYTHKTCFTERSLSQVINLRFGVNPDFFPWYRLGDSWKSMAAVICSRILGRIRFVITAIDIGTGNKIFTPNLIAIIRFKDGIND